MLFVVLSGVVSSVIPVDSLDLSGEILTKNVVSGSSWLSGSALAEGSVTLSSAGIREHPNIVI